MKPFLYQYKKTDEGYILYVHQLHTIDGLKAIGNHPINLTTFGATSYKNLGYATENDIPDCKSTIDLINFLEQHPTIGLVEFEVEIMGKGKIATHNDGECRFTFNNKQELISILKHIAPKTQTDFVVAAVLDNTNFYVSIDLENNVEKFATIEQYLLNRN